MYISKPIKAFSLCSSTYESSSADSDIHLNQKALHENDAYFKMMGIQMLCNQKQQT